MGDIYGVRVTPDGDTVNSFCISQASNAQFDPDVAFGCGQYMTVWCDNRAGHPCYRIYAARILPSGTILDTKGMQIGPPDSSYQFGPAISFNGTKFFITWGYRLVPYRILGRFIDTSGTVSDTVKISTAYGPVTRTKIAMCDTGYMAAWLENMLGVMIVRGQILSLDGTPVGSPFSIASPVHPYSLSLHYDGIQYCVSYCLFEGSVYRAWGRKYDVNGSPIDTAFRITPSPNNQYYSDFIPGGNNSYLNVWSENRTDYDIYGNLDIPITGIREYDDRFCRNRNVTTTIWSGPLLLPGNGKYTIVDISGRQIHTLNPAPGIYFIVVDGTIRHKVVKIN